MSRSGLDFYSGSGFKSGYETNCRTGSGFLTNSLFFGSISLLIDQAYKLWFPKTTHSFGNISFRLHIYECVLRSRYDLLGVTVSMFSTNLISRSNFNFDKIQFEP